MAFINPSVSEFKQQFFRDFPYQPSPGAIDLSKYIQDQDIAQAYQETNINFNPELWADQSSFTLGYLLLSAHYLVMNIRASSQGISGQFNWNSTNKSVGSVSEGFQIPQRILDNPEFAMLSQTTYGARFLFLVLPQLSGMIFPVAGSTRP